MWRNIDNRKKKNVGETTLSHIRIHRVSVNDDYDFIPKRKKGKKHVHVVLKTDQLLPRNEKVGAWRPVESSWLHRPFDHSLRSFCWAFWGCHLFFVGSVFPAWVIVIWMKKQNLEDLFVRWFFIHILKIHHINSMGPHTRLGWFKPLDVRIWLQKLKRVKDNKGIRKNRKNQGSFFFNTSKWHKKHRDMPCFHVYLAFFLSSSNEMGGVLAKKNTTFMVNWRQCPFIRRCQLHFALKNFHLRWKISRVSTSGHLGKRIFNAKWHGKRQGTMRLSEPGMHVGKWNLHHRYHNLIFMFLCIDSHVCIFAYHICMVHINAYI